MFIDKFFKRRLASLLRPWLQQELELDVKLGFLASHGVANNLFVDVWVLNQQLFDESSRWYFRDITVEQLSIRVSYWSLPSFIIEARGFHVTLSLRELDGGLGPKWKSVDAALEDRKRFLSEIDPEGSALHEVMEKLSRSSSSGNWKTSLLNVAFKCCQLQMHDIDLQVQFPNSEDSVRCFSKVKEFNVETPCSEHGCFLSGCISSLFSPSKDSSFSLDIRCLEIGLKNKDHISQPISVADLLIHTKLKDLQLMDLDLSIPELIFSISPVDLHVIFAFYTLSSDDTIFVQKRGRQLWNLAARRVRSLTSISRLSFHKLVAIVCLWVRYVNAYENLLLLVGYPSENNLRMSAAKMSKDDIYSVSFKHQLKMVSEIEMKLPAEAVARARGIARYRVACAGQVKNNSNNLLDSGCHKFFRRVLVLLGLVWSVICGILKSFVSLLLHIFLDDLQKSDGPLDVSEYFIAQSSFSASLGAISIIVSPIDNICLPVGEDPGADVGSSSLDLRSFQVIIDGLFLTHTENISEQCFAFSCGHLKVVSLSPAEDGSKNRNSHLKGHQRKEFGNVNTIMCSDPAQNFCFMKNSRPATANEIEGSSASFLWDILSEMRSNWELSCKKFEGSMTQYLENPWILCEIKKFITDQSLKNLNSGFWKCSLIVGKLSFLLDYSLILSTARVFREMQHALRWTDSTGRAKVTSTTLITCEAPSMPSGNGRIKSYISNMENTMLKMIPQKHIEIAMFIVGPLIQISLRKEGFFQGHANENCIGRQDDLCLVVDVCDTELAVWPTLGSDYVASSEHQRSTDVDLEFLRPKDSQVIGLPKSKDENYMCQGRIALGCYLKIHGLNVYFNDSTANQQHQIIVVNPITTKLSSSREDVQSFSTSNVAVSVALQGMAVGLTVLLFMDELLLLVKELGGLFSAVSYDDSGFDAFLNFHQLIKQEIACPDSERHEAFVARSGSLLFKKSVFVIDGTFDLKSVDIVLHNSRERSTMENPVIKFDTADGKNVARHSLPEYGILISLQQKSLNFSCNEEEVEIIAELSEISSYIFRDQSNIWKNCSQFQLRNILHSLSCLQEVSLSRCEFALRLTTVPSAFPSGSLGHLFDDSSAGSNVMNMEEGSSEIGIGRSNDRNFNFLQRLGFAPNGVDSASGHWFLFSIGVTEIYLVGSLVKKILVGSQKSNKLQFILCIGREFQTIVKQIQGGSILLETMALKMFVECFVSYHQCMQHVFNVVPANVDQISTKFGDNMAIRENDLQQMAWQQLESLSIDVSGFSLLLVAADGCGRLMQLQFGVDFQLNLELENMKKRLFFDLSHLSILSQFLNETGEQQSSESKIPHFSSLVSDNLSPEYVQDSPAEIRPLHSYASCSSGGVSQNEVRDVALGVLNSSHQNYILKRLGASVSVERPEHREGIGPSLTKHVWFGSCSITGFDVTLSISEIQMLLSTVESLSGLFRKDTSADVELRQFSGNQESDRTLDETVPDGAVIAIQDVHQHLYVTVEDVESKYSLVGAIHYSLVGEKALFRVKYQNQKRWKSSVEWFSLISLYAKSDSGEPFRLNYRPGSGFLDISSTNDGRWALWKRVSCEPDSFEGDIELGSYNFAARNTFYLVNKKSDRSVAFVDGVPEFVNKPGNPFKWKVFHDLSISRNNVLLDHHSGEASSSMQHNWHMNQERASEQTISLPNIDIKIDNILLTIVYEFPGIKEKFPLLQASVSTVESILQILLSKARFISTLVLVLYYFDAQNNLWREFIHPVEICIFYRSHFLIQGSEIGFARVPVHFYARMKQLGVSITELSLDMLLFVIGKLNLAGPFAVNTSAIFSNCCKVENQSGMDLVCYFYDNQDVSIARKQSSTIIFRHTLANQPPEASHVSIQLADRGAYLTSPICFSLLSPRAVACRTRLMSLQDSKSYPGPFVVVDISGIKEDGLSVVVSPLLKIHNETKFALELRFRRPQRDADESACVLLKSGDTIDDSVAAFDAKSLSGGLKKTLMSIILGNFLLSFRPIIREDLRNPEKSVSGEWSDDVKGGKAVLISGLFDKLSYKVRRAFSVESVRCSFSTAHCSFKYDDGQTSELHFLIQSFIRDIPVIQPDYPGYAPGNRESPATLQGQKEIFLLPTVRVLNLLQTEIHVLLTDRDPCTALVSENIGNQANVPSGSTVDLYVNPATIYFVVTLTAFNSSCKPQDTGRLLKKLQKQKSDVHYVDIDLVFEGAKYFASLRLSRGHQGTLEATIFTSYALKNDTDFFLLCFASNQTPLSRDEAEKLDFKIPPELGSFLPPNSTESWFMKHSKVRLKFLEGTATEALLDLDTLSGLTEIGLEVEERSGFKYVAKLGVSSGPFLSKENLLSQLVSIVPRYVLFNESEESINIRQCYLEDDMAGMFTVSSKQKMALMLWSGKNKRKEISVFDKFVRKHRNAHDDTLMYIQFQLDGAGWGWSGPVCVASLGRFFLKFRRLSDFSLQQSNQVNGHGNNSTEFAAVHVVEESSTLVLHFHKPSNVNLPYRIENSLRQTFITYYQKGSLEPENLGCGTSVDYVWDDMTLPHRLVVQINGMNLLREINLDKVRSWKPFYKVSHQRGLRFHLPLDKKLGDAEKASFGESIGMQMVNVGYEVYADGPTRVLKFCEFSDRHKQDIHFPLSGKIRFRISYFSIDLLEHSKKEVDTSEPSVFTPLVVTRFENINLDSVLTDKYSNNKIGVQSFSVDQKWVGAPFAAMLRRHQSDYSNADDNILRVVVVLVSSSSNVKQVKYSSVMLQPVDLNLDEETLMRLVPFWRTSLSDSNSQRQQYYFDHFEIHPIKIIASFLPGDSYSSYSSTQEMLRSLIHSVIKIPAIRSMTVELNGVLVTHALITIRELLIKCAQHYSWYGMRAIYIAKGSPLLPPAFASVFDDLASSSLDVFFDPSSVLVNLPGLTAGTFKLISKCIDGKGFSGTRRYLGDLGKTMRTAGSNVVFAAVTEISDSVLKGAEANGFNGMVSGFHHGILKLAMEPSLLGTALIEGGPDRKIVLDRNPGVDELYIEGYLQAMLDTIYQQEFLRVRVVDNQVILKNLPPNSTLMEEIIDRVKGFLISKALLKGDSSTSQPLRHLRGDSEWKIGPTVLTLCEHLFVSFAIRFLRKRSGKFTSKIRWKENLKGDDQKAINSASTTQGQKVKLFWKWGIAKFLLSGIVAYIDGRLCRCIPNPVARRIVSGFLLSFLGKNDHE